MSIFRVRSHKIPIEIVVEVLARSSKRQPNGIIQSNPTITNILRSKKSQVGLALGSDPRSNRGTWHKLNVV